MCLADRNLTQNPLEWMEETFVTDLLDDGFMLRDVGIQSTWLLVQDVDASLYVVKIIPMHNTDATSLDV